MPKVCDSIRNKHKRSLKELHISNGLTEVDNSMKVFATEKLDRTPNYPENHRGIWTNTRQPVIILLFYINFAGTMWWLHMRAINMDWQSTPAVQNVISHWSITVLSWAMETSCKSRIAKLLWWGGGVQHLANSLRTRQHVWKIWP